MAILTDECAMLINRRQALIGSVGAAVAGLAAYPAFGQSGIIGPFILAGIFEAALVIANAVTNDNAKREAFTVNVVKEAVNKNPNYNVVICHPPVQVSGPNVVHHHYELKMAVGTCGYDLYASPLNKPFTFRNLGDGGALNWAYGGNFTRNGNTLTAK